MESQYNNRVLAVCSGIPTQLPDWSSLCEDVTSRFKPVPERPLDLGTVVDFIAEQHVRTCLETSVSNNRNGFNVILGSPGVIIHKGSRFDYTNRNGSIRFYDHSAHNGILYCQFDYSANVDGIPAFFEVSIGKYANKGGNSNNGRGVRKSMGLKRQLSKDGIKRLFLPLKMSFGDDFTYTIIVAKDTVYKMRNNNSNLSRLVERWANVIPIYATREQFRADVMAECEKRSIPLKCKSQSC